MKVLKFGGKSLAPGKPLEKALQIVLKEQATEPVAVVVSAIGETTNLLQEMYLKSTMGEVDSDSLIKIKSLGEAAGLNGNFLRDLNELEDIIRSNATLKLDSDQVRDHVLSFGEIQSARTLVTLLKSNGLKACFFDARKFIKVERLGVDYEVNLEETKQLVLEAFSNLKAQEIPVITGFIGSDKDGKTVTLGRNGTNYSATLLASFIGATEVQNWTNVNGIYAASPAYVPDAQKISHLSYKEAHELANFGTNVLHAKTIEPLIEGSIPLRIKNSFYPENEGTLIDSKGADKGIKAVSVIENVSLVKIKGAGLLGKIGIDARIFNVLSQNNISVRIISQASSERGIGFVVDTEVAKKARQVLLEEFELDIQSQAVSTIEVDHEMAILAIIGRHNYALEKAIQGLRRNKIWMHLISNSISGEHISLVVDNYNLNKAVKVVYGKVFGVRKRINLLAIGKGTVGSRLIDQILATDESVIARRGLEIRLVGILNSKKMLLSESGIQDDWRTQLEAADSLSDLDEAMNWLEGSTLENIVIADNTASSDVTDRYPEFVERGFDVVVSNKKFNSGPLDRYQEMQQSLKRKGKHFLYETNVGAGLPLIDTLRNLYNSADVVIQVRGVFSGSLSFLFNEYSESDVQFTDVLLEAKNRGFTEPDPREDLSGMDVARKLIILAREIGMEVELKDINVQSLIPEHLSEFPTFDDFMKHQKELDVYFGKLKSELGNNEVLRYTGELNSRTGEMEVKLVKVSKDLPLGNIKGTDAIFEIYTEGYGDQPVIIQGAGAGADVTARGVYSDLLRVGTQLH